MTVRTTLIMQAIQAHLQIRSRVTAIVMNDRWDKGNEDPRAYLDLENIMWAVATNNTITEKVRTAMEADQDNPENVERGIMLGVEDGDLEFVVLTVAIPRLKQEDEKEKQPKEE